MSLKVYEVGISSWDVSCGVLYIIEGFLGRVCLFLLVCMFCDVYLCC